MSGHNKWSTIKRKKGAEDAKRGQVFTRLAREVAIAAREGGGELDTNVRLRLAVDRARAQNMPKDSIERAIKRGTGESKDGIQIEEIMYEGYGPHGVAIIIECLTENRNRTVADIRHALSRTGGNLAEAGSVAWQFNRMAYFSIPADKLDYDNVFELAVECGADDITMDEEIIEIYAPVESFKMLSDRLRSEKIHADEASLRMIPNQEIELDVDSTVKAMRAIEAIEDLDDVRNVFSNIKISEDALAVLELE